MLPLHPGHTTPQQGRKVNMVLMEVAMEEVATDMEDMVAMEVEVVDMEDMVAMVVVVVGMEATGAMVVVVATTEVDITFSANFLHLHKVQTAK